MAELTLTGADNGTHVRVRVGDGITIHLPENAATGYHWTVSSLDVTHVVVESQSYQSRSAAVGSAGTAVLELRAKMAGTTRVELKKSRPWEPADSAIERFAVNLEIINS